MKTKQIIAYIIVTACIASIGALIAGTKTETVYNKNGIEVAQSTLFSSVTQCKMVFGTDIGYRDGFDTALLTLKTKSATQLEVEAKYKSRTPEFGWVKSDKFGQMFSLDRGESHFKYDVLQEIADSNFFIVSAKHVKAGPNDNAPDVRISGSDSLAASQAMVDCMSKMK